ncbi:hypothetical protein HJ588_13345 [Flexivirga sp. ID2601S]|uniref:Uncharacterized protein n=1 Tax=Flexivirga aerilata TaxID=1656889 RepID=A0A849AU58_9MICO|nr:hypothetical protein [Flexivirga aerilata]NNG40252.1 hypothetical protein [Flexivirga aerilata]
MTANSRRTMSFWRLAAALMAVQTAVLVILALVLIVVTLTGNSSDTARALTEAATVLALAVCGGLLAFGFWRERSVARTPSLLWNGLAAITGLTLATSGAPAIGAAVGLIAVITFVITLGVPRYELEDDAPES